jgi:flagellar basal-body rod protein FlgB
MTPVYLFSLASQHNTWLSVRQSALAGNIANANTPGYKAMDAAEFESVLNSVPLTMKTTHAGHIDPTPSGPPVVDVREEESWEVLHSGNNVSLEQELLKAGEVNRSFATNAGVLKAFQRMLLTSSKG